MQKQKFDITGMTCAACQANVTRAVQKLEGVDNVNVSLLANQMTVSFDDSKILPDEIISTVTGIGYGASIAGSSKEKPDDFRSEWNARKNNALNQQISMRNRLLISIILLIPLMYVSMGQMIGLWLPDFLVGSENAAVSALTQLLLTIPIMFVNRKFFTSGFKALVKRAPNMDSLVAIGSSASFIYGVFALYRILFGIGHSDFSLVHLYSHELYFESSAMILTLVTVGKYLEAKSKSKTSDALDKLVDLAPKTAVVERGGKTLVVPAEQVVSGDIVVIKPGEVIPVDGIVIEGNGYVDQSAITGESIPVEKNVGDSVISATMNKNGTMKFRALKVGSDTTLAQIIRLVDDAGNTKAPIARAADKVSGVFVPVVMAIALITAVVWLIFGSSFEFAFSLAISVLVISCPCALGLATPVAIMVGTGKAAENGILIKSAESLENLHNIDTVVLDKTGTITSGKPAVTDVEIFSNNISKDEFIALAAAVESGSEHPLACAVVEYAEKNKIIIPKADKFESVTGRGVHAYINGVEYFVGNFEFIKENNINMDKNPDDCVNKHALKGKTPLLFAREKELIGVIAVADTIRETSREAIRRFKEKGLHVVMLTGDNAITAQAIKEEIGIEKAIAEVMPAQKESCIREIQEKGNKVAMIGDGINDAPALARADIGIAIGAGTDIAIDSADVVLMKDSLLDVVTAFDLSKSVVRNIHMNLFWAFFYNILGIPIAAGALYPLIGLKLSPMLGSAAMSLSSVCVVLNALRLRFFKPQKYDTKLIKTQSVQTDKLSELKGKVNMKKILTVEGMSCSHCSANVQKALEQVEGVKSASVDLESKKATVELSENVDNDVLIKAVAQAGYEPVKCE